MFPMYREELSLACQPHEKTLDYLTCQARFESNGRSYLCKLPLRISGQRGEQALSHYFSQFIEDVESDVARPAAVILEAIQGEGGVKIINEPECQSVIDRFTLALNGALATSRC